MRAEVRLIFIFLSLGSLILASALPGSHAASTYLPGVKTGNAAAYSVSASWGLPSPPSGPFSQFIKANFTRLSITGVTGTNITANQVTTYTNGTTLVDLIQGDVATDSGNITFWLISENLTTGDPIYTTQNAPIINETLLETFAGTPRTLDVYNATQIFPGGQATIDAWWDQQTGILLQLGFDLATQSGSAFLFIRLIATNIWSPGPGFGIFAIPNPLMVPIGGSNSSLLFFVSERGFSGGIAIDYSFDNCFSFCPRVSLQPMNVFLSSGNETSVGVLVEAPNGTRTGNVLLSLFAGSGPYIGNSTTLTVIVAGSTPDIPPVANFFVQAPNSTTVLRVGQPALFEASTSYDPDGFITAYSWDFGDGTQGFNEFQSHTYSNTGNFTVTLTVTDNAGLTGTTRRSTLVTEPIIHDIGIIAIIAQPRIAVSGQTVQVGVALINAGAQTETFNVTIYRDQQVAATIQNISLPPELFPNFFYANWDTTGIPAGNYTISATAFLPTDQNPSNNHLSDGIVTILPPPILTATPSRGPVGTKVQVQGTGFQTQSSSYPYPQNVEVTFDDQFLGFTTLDNQGTFTFTFNVPLSQPGPHTIQAYAQVYPSQIEATTNFTVTTTAPSSGLSISINTGTIYFSGDTAVTYILTSQQGVPITPGTLRVSIILPNGNLNSLSVTAQSPGQFRATYSIPKTSSIGTYAIIATAQLNGINATGLGGFEVKPTWIQANGRNLVTASALTGAIGMVAVIAVAWQKGYFPKRKSEKITTHNLTS